MAMRSNVRCLIFTFFAGAVLPLAADDWPHWRGQNFNGISKEKHWTTAWPKEGPKQLWKANVGTGFSTMSVANSRVFTMGNRGGEDTLYCLDAKTGAALWKH